MPQAPTITNNASTTIATACINQIGVTIWSTQSAPLYVRFNQPSAAAGGNMGIYMPPGTTDAPARLTRMFDSNRSICDININVFQNSGSDVTSGVGYEFIY
jgi:hypothetical protein